MGEPIGHFSYVPPMQEVIGSALALNIISQGTYVMGACGCVEVGGLVEVGKL